MEFKEKIALTKKIVERVMEPGSNCGCSWLHCHKLTIWFVQGFTCFMEVSQVLEHFTDHLLLGADHEAHDVVAQGVPVLVQEALNVVPHLTSVVLDAKLHAVHPWPGVELAEGMVVVTFLQEREVSRFGEVRFIVKEMEDSHRLLGEHVYDRLVV